MIGVGAEVEHADYGSGTVQSVLGAEAEVLFFGDSIFVRLDELTPREAPAPRPVASPDEADGSAIAFRRMFEAVNLGIVPTEPAQLVALTIEGVAEEQKIALWLERAPKDGLCKVFFGGYGTGKSHHLRLVEAAALRDGWVTSFVEFDPKAADPAKPHLVYRELMSALKFPERNDGSRSEHFHDLVKDVRDHWPRVSSGKLFKTSPWWAQSFRILLEEAHSDRDDYRQAAAWLPGFAKDATALKALARRAGISPSVLPKMPLSRETADIYVFHLVVLNEICRALGYKGLALILDEAETTRGYPVRRRERATSFFDLLARAAHQPVPRDAPPARNDHDLPVPEFWKTGPHFALFVGLTEGDIFADPDVPLREACVFLHDAQDRVTLAPPLPGNYRGWCDKFLEGCAAQLGPLPILGVAAERARVADLLGDAFAALPSSERVLRVWIKLAALAPAILMCGHVTELTGLLAELRRACDRAAGQHLPWEG